LALDDGISWAAGGERVVRVSLGPGSGLTDRGIPCLFGVQWERDDGGVQSFVGGVVAHNGRWWGMRLRNRQQRWEEPLKQDRVKGRWRRRKKKLEGWNKKRKQKIKRKKRRFERPGARPKDGGVWRGS
jgi:hypothetical protein